MKRYLVELPYTNETSSRIGWLIDEPWAVFLSSGGGTGYGARFDIFAAQPEVTLISRSECTEIRAADGNRIRVYKGDPFETLRHELKIEPASSCGLPFCGGAIGYFGYDLARRIERLPETTKDDESIPEMMVGIYDWAYIADHQEKRSWLVSAGRYQSTNDKWEDLVKQFSEASDAVIKNRSAVLSELTNSTDFEFYSAAFKKAKRYILDGDCYQVNLAQRFEAKFQGDPWIAYLKLLGQTRAPFSAYLNFPEVAVLSVSPERFLQVRKGEVVTQPIKGTAPRSKNAEEDELLSAALASSAKNRAENLMIVDLMRNDLSKSCKLNSVRVPRLFELQSFSSVHHLVSTVKGQLREKVDAIELLRGCFPGGSITGAPKIRAMEIIEELESHRRGVYCGSIGYLGFDGSMDTSIAIRTATLTAGRMRYWAGGGLVADSTLEEEFQESLDKAEVFFKWVQDLEGF
ncbi:MAG: aminodeoxychorismate synthase component I [Thiotrichales bacterium]